MVAVVALKNLQGLMPGDSHDSQVVNASPPHVRDSGMAEVVKVKPSIPARLQAAWNAVFAEWTDFPFTKKTCA